MSDNSTEWQPQQPPASLGLARSSSMGWRHNIPGSLTLCRKRAGSDGGKEPPPPITTSPTGLRKKGTRAVVRSEPASNREKEVEERTTNPASALLDGLRQHPVTTQIESQRQDGFASRSSSLNEGRSRDGLALTELNRAATAPARRSKSKTHDHIEVPRIPDIHATLANRAVVEKQTAMPSVGLQVGLAKRQKTESEPEERPQDPTRLQQREAPRYAAAMTKSQHLLVISERDSEGPSAITSVSASASPLSIITTFKLRTPADSPDIPNSPSPWDRVGTHERFVDGIEFEMLDAPSAKPLAPASAVISTSSSTLVSPLSLSPAVLPRIAADPQATSPESSSAKPMSPSMAPHGMRDISSSKLLSPRLNDLSSSRASSILLPESMMPGISRRLSEISTGSRTTITVNGASITIPRVPPPPPPKTPGPAMTLTPDLSKRESRRLSRSKSYSALPPSCPKGTLPRPVSKYNPQLITTFEDKAPPVPVVSASHTPSSSVSSMSSTGTTVMSPMNKISLAASGSPMSPQKVSPRDLSREASPKGMPSKDIFSPTDFPQKSAAPKKAIASKSESLKPVPDTLRIITNLPRPGPPPSRPPPPPPPRLTGLGILDTPPAPSVARTAPVTRSPTPTMVTATNEAHISLTKKPSLTRSLKRQSSGSDKDGRKPTDVVKKIDSGIKKKDTGLSRTKSEARRVMVKKMALDNIGAVKVREPSRSPQKPKKKVDLKSPIIKSPLIKSPLLNPQHPRSPDMKRMQSRNTMLRIQAHEQDKISSLNVELDRLQAQCSEAKRHHEALYMARQRLFNEFPSNDDRKSVSSLYFDDQESSNGSGPMSPGKEEALADIDEKIRKWKQEMQQNEHKRNRIQKKLAWHSTDRLAVIPLPGRPTPSPSRHQVKTPRVVTPMTAKSFASEYTLSSTDLGSVPALLTPRGTTPTEVPDKMPELDDARRPSVDSTGSLMTPPQSPLTRSNEPWIGLESPFTPFLDTPTQTASQVSALNVRHAGNATADGGVESLRSPEPREDRQMTIQVFAESGITDLMASLQSEIDHLSRRVRT